MDTPEMIYFNNAATSYPKAPGVGEAVKRAIDHLPGAANRGGIRDFDVFDAVRQKLARLLGIENHNQIALGQNATWALNLAIFGFPYPKEAVILTGRAEHNSVLRPLYALEQRGIARVIYLDVDRSGRIPEDAWEEAVRNNQPALCVFMHASNVTGAVNDAEKLSKIAKAHGAAVLLDASQTAGWVPVEAGKWDVDLLAFTGHKYLLGPQGTGGLYVKPGKEIRPWLVGGTGIHSDVKEMPEEMPLHLEAGTGNEPSFHGLLTALAWAEENPLDREKHALSFASLKTRLKTAGAEIIDPGDPCTPVLSFTVPGFRPDEAAEILTSSYDILCRTGLHCAPLIFENLEKPEGTVRISLSRFTTDAERDALVEAVSDLVQAT